MSKFRKDRVGELVRQVISEVVAVRIKDPRVIGVTITEVKMSADLKSATVYFAGLADGKEELHKKGLTSATGFIRRELRKELDLKYVPEITFFYDNSFDNSQKISNILKGLAIDSETE